MQQWNGAADKSGYLGVGLAAAVAAASAALLLDPRSGARRRARLRDQLYRASHETQAFLGKAGRDARQRARGLYSESLATLRQAGIDDGVLTERVRAALGRLTSHPGAVDVSCSGGVVRLSGDVLQREAAIVFRGVGRVRGVRDVVNEMRVHHDAGRLPALQGAGVPRSLPRFEYLQSNWSPAPRLIAGAVGLALIAGGVARRSAAGYGLAAAGAGLLARSICNAPLSHLVGLRTSDADDVLVQKTLEVYAEVNEVYECWRDLEGFPRFMSHVRDVRRMEDGRYHWTVDGPAGYPVEWDSEVTADVPDELIAWRTVNGSVVRSSGVVQFEPSPQGGTRIHIRMSYRPPGNTLGHTVAKVFGRDPRRQIDTDLVRFKSYMESGALRLAEHSAANMLPAEAPAGAGSYAP